MKDKPDFSNVKTCKYGICMEDRRFFPFHTSNLPFHSVLELFQIPTDFFLPFHTIVCPAHFTHPCTLSKNSPKRLERLLIAASSFRARGKKDLIGMGEIWWGKQETCPPTCSGGGDIICHVPSLFLFRFCIWRSSKNKWRLPRFV